jgi:hypothetical protein
MTTTTGAKTTKPTAKKVASKPKAKPMYAKGDVIRAAHPTKHPEVGEAIVQADFYDAPKAAYIPVVFRDNDLKISVHRNRLEKPSAA